MRVGDAGRTQETASVHGPLPWGCRELILRVERIGSAFFLTGLAWSLQSRRRLWEGRRQDASRSFRDKACDPKALPDVIASSPSDFQCSKRTIAPASPK